MTEVDRLSRNRRILLAAYGVMFLSLQAVVFNRQDDPIAQWRPIHWTFAVGYIGWSFTLIYVLATNGALFRGSPQAAAALNDELTQANRAFAYRIGYWSVLIVLAALFVLGQFFELSRSEVLRVTFAVAVAMPACAFAGRERRQGG